MLDPANSWSTAKWADEYFPFYAIHPSDGCKTHGVVYRLSPHPADASKLTITYDVLYDSYSGITA